ncbi:MAG TPA: hypothetical protein VJB98_03320 [Candidatus Paceibacterota bacterium]
MPEGLLYGLAVFVLALGGFFTASTLFCGFWSANRYLATNVFLGLYTREKTVWTGIAAFSAAAISVFVILTSGSRPVLIPFFGIPYLAGLLLFFLLWPLYRWYTTSPAKKKVPVQARARGLGISASS